MEIDISNRLQRKVCHATWRPYTAVMAILVQLSAVLFYLYSTVRDITVGLQRLQAIYVVNGSAEIKRWMSSLQSCQLLIHVGSGLNSGE